MFSTPVLRRIGLAKALGLLIGIVVAWVMCTTPSVPFTFALGIGAWFLTLGVMIGLSGFINHVPVLSFALPTWARGGWVGLWMGLVLVLLTKAQLDAAFGEITWLPEMFHNGWWFIADTAIAGLLIDVIITRLTGKLEWPGSGTVAPTET